MTSIEARSNTRSEMRRGALLMVLGSAIIPASDAVAKLLTDTHGVSPGTVAFLRFFLQSAFALPLIAGVHGLGALKVRHPVLNVLRGMLLGLSGILFFSALKFMPLADATAIFFIEPILVTILSALLLRERIGRARIAAVFCGFLGTLIVIRPNLVSLGIVAILPVLTAVFVALYAVLNRHLAGTGRPLAMHFYSGLGGCIVLLPIVAAGHLSGYRELAFSVPADGAVFGLLLAIGLIATVAHLMFIQAYHDAPASLLAPLGYVEIPAAVLLGLLLFGDFPDAVGLAGIGVIAFSGLFLVLWDRQSPPVPLSDQP